MPLMPDVRAVSPIVHPARTPGREQKKTATRTTIRKKEVASIPGRRPSPPREPDLCHAKGRALKSQQKSRDGPDKKAFISGATLSILDDVHRLEGVRPTTLSTMQKASG